jgi:uncharacterized membrane protein
MSKLKATAPKTLEQDAASKDRLGLERLIFFSDAVFAIAITLLVLDIRLPSGADSASDRQLLLLLAGLWHKYLAYFISFWVIGLCWISHHRKFLHIQRVDNQLLSLNLLMLMMIAFIPFPTAVMSENVNFTATGFYALIMTLACLSGLILWWHAARNHNLIDPHLDKHQVWREASVPAATIAIFVLSMGVAFFDAGLARICWVFVFPVSLFLRRKAT